LLQSAGLRQGMVLPTPPVPLVYRRSPDRVVIRGPQRPRSPPCAARRRDPSDVRRPDRPSTAPPASASAPAPPPVRRRDFSKPRRSSASSERPDRPSTAPVVTTAAPRGRERAQPRDLSVLRNPSRTRIGSSASLSREPLVVERPGRPWTAPPASECHPRPARSRDCPTLQRPSRPSTAPPRAAAFTHHRVDHRRDPPGVRPSTQRPPSQPRPHLRTRSWSSPSKRPSHQLEAPAGQPAPKKRKTQNCPMCGRALSDVNSHLCREHLPWFLRVQHACFQCTASHPGVRDREMHLRFAPSHGMASVEGLEKEWAEVVQGFLERLAHECGLSTVEELPAFVRERGLYPENSRGHPATPVEPAAFLFARHSGGTLPEGGLVTSPPNHLAALLHPRTLAPTLLTTSAEFQGAVPSWGRQEWLREVEEGRRPFVRCTDCRTACRGCAKHRRT
jgi:hypothetical protein